MEILHQLKTWTGVNRESFCCAFQAQRCLLLFLDEMLGWEVNCVNFMPLEQTGRCLVLLALIIKHALPEWPSKVVQITQSHVCCLSFITQYRDFIVCASFMGHLSGTFQLYTSASSPYSCSQPFLPK